MEQELVAPVVLVVRVVEQVTIIPQELVVEQVILLQQLLPKELMVVIIILPTVKVPEIPVAVAVELEEQHYLIRVHQLKVDREHQLQ
jgi:hypothetical protein